MLSIQAECLHRLQHLLPRLSSPQDSREAFIDRIIGTCPFLQRKMDHHPSLLDQKKVLHLCHVFAGLEGNNPKLERTLEQVLFYVKKNAAAFLCITDSTFMESLLESLLAVSAMQRNVVDTVIGIFKQMAQFDAPTRALALQKLTMFMSTRLLTKAFVLHPSVDVVAEELIKHIRITDYLDYEKFNIKFKSNLVYHALTGLRAVVNTYLVHGRSCGRQLSTPGKHAKEGPELAALVKQCAAVSCSLLKQKREIDQEFKIEVEAVRLLLTCGRVESDMYGVAYHAGIFLFRRELRTQEPSAEVYPLEDTEDQPRPRANTDYAVRPDLSSSRGGSGTLVEGSRESAPGVGDGQNGDALDLSRGSFLRTSLLFDSASIEENEQLLNRDKDQGHAVEKKDRQIPMQNDEYDHRISVDRLAILWSLVKALFQASQSHMEHCLGLPDKDTAYYAAQIKAVMSAMSDCLLKFIFSNDAALRCVSLSSICPIDHIMGVFQQSESRDSLGVDDGFAAGEFESLMDPALHEISNIGEESTHPQTTNDNSTFELGGQSTAAPHREVDVTNERSDKFLSAYRRRFVQKNRTMSSSELVYTALIDISRLIVSKHSAYFKGSIAARTFRSVSEEVYAVLCVTEPLSDHHDSHDSHHTKLQQRVANMLDYSSHLLELCENAARNLGDTGSCDEAPAKSAPCGISVESCYPVLVDMLSHSTHRGVLKHIVLFINKCVRIFGAMGRIPAKLRICRKIDGSGGNLFDITLDLYCATLSRSFDAFLGALSVKDVVEVTKLVNKKGKPPEYLSDAHSRRFRRTASVAKCLCDGLAGLIGDLLLNVGGTHDCDDAVFRHLSVYRKLISMQKALLNTFVELSGHLLTKALDCFLLYSGTGYATLTQYLSESICLNGGSQLQILEYMLLPLATIFESIKSTTDSITDILMKKYTECATSPRLVLILDELISVDMCNLTVLRGFWTYVGLFGFLKTSKMRHLRSIAHFGDSCLVPSAVRFRKVYNRLMLRCGHKLNESNFKKWNALMERSGGNKGHTLLLALEVCPISLVVQGCATKSSHRNREKVNASDYVKMQKSVVSLLNSNISAISTLNQHNRFRIDEDLSCYPGEHATVPPIGKLASIVSQVVKSTNRCNVSKLNLSMVLFTSGMSVLEAIRVEKCTSSNAFTREELEIDVRDNSDIISEYLLDYVFDVLMQSHHKPTSGAENFWKCVSASAFMLWQQWCRYSGELLYGSSGVSSSFLSKRRRSDVIINMKYLLTQLSNPSINAVVRKFSLMFIYTLINACPWCLWNGNILGTLLSRCSFLENIRRDATDQLNVTESNYPPVAVDSNLVSASILSEVSVTYISLTYHWCSVGSHFFPSLMTSAVMDYQLLLTHPFLHVRNAQARNVATPRTEVDYTEPPLGLEIAKEMAGPGGVPTFQSTTPSTPPHCCGKGDYDKLTRVESPLAIERRMAASDVCTSFNRSGTESKKRKSANCRFPAMRWKSTDSRNLRYVDLAARSYVFGSLLEVLPGKSKPVGQITACWASMDDSSRVLAYGTILDSFSLCRKGLEACWKGHESDKAAEIAELLKKLQRCILQSAGFVRLSAERNIFDGYVVSCVSIIGKCVAMNFTEETARVASDAFLWLLSTQEADIVDVVLNELSNVLRFSAEAQLGIFARRESIHSNVRMSDATSDAGSDREKPTLVAVPTLFSTHSTIPAYKAKFIPSVGDQLAAHATIIEFLDFIFEVVLTRTDLQCILFSCMEVILMNLSIYPSLYGCGSISTSNASKASASHFSVGIGVPMFRLLGLGLKILDHYTRLREAAGSDDEVSCYNTTSVTMVQYCENNNISVAATEHLVSSPVLTNIFSRMKDMYVQSHLQCSLNTVSPARKRILRERIYSFVFIFFNSPNNSLNNSPRTNIYFHKESHPSPNRCIDTEINTLLDFFDLVQADADSSWDLDYTCRGADQSKVGCAFEARDRRPGPAEVVQWVDQVLHISDRKPANSTSALDGIRSVLFNPRSILAHQIISASGAQYVLTPPEGDAEAHLSESSVLLQRFCGIYTGDPACSDHQDRKKGDSSSIGAQATNQKVLRAVSGVLHLAKMCVAVQLDRMYAWRAVVYDEFTKNKLRHKKCPTMSDYQLSTMECNISRRTAVLTYFHEVCCTKSGIHAAVLSAWAFHPSLSLRLDQAFQYRSLTHDLSSKTAIETYKVRMNAIVNILVAENRQVYPGTGAEIAQADIAMKRNALDLMSPRLTKHLYEFCIPRISDLIAHNPVALRADYSSAGYVLGIVGDITFRSASKATAKNLHTNASDRAMSQLRMWAIYGDKNIHTIFSKLSPHEDTANPADIYLRPEYELDYHHNSLLREQQQRAVKNTVSHRCAHCPMYLLSHWALAPPDYAISLLQRPILTHSGKTIVRQRSSENEVDDNRQLECWQARLHLQSFVVQYVIRSLSALDPETLLFYLPQLVQLLRRDESGAIRTFLEEQSRTSDLLCHQLVWLLETESVSEAEADAANKSSDHRKPNSSSQEENDLPAPVEGHPDGGNYERTLVVRSEILAGSHHFYGYCNQLHGFDPLPKAAQRLHRSILSSLSPRALSYMNLECEYFNGITNISAKLALIKNKDLHNRIIKEELGKVGFSKGLYLPTDPHRLLVGLDVNSGTPMQSAAKCPFLLVFRTVEWGGPDSVDIDSASVSCASERHEIHGTDAQPSILSNKVLPNTLQPVRVPRANSAEAFDIENIGKPVVDTSPAARGGNISLFENGIPAEEYDDANEEGSDDPSKDFANLRKSRGKAHSSNYHTLLVNNYDDPDSSMAETSLSELTDNNSNKKAYSASAIRKDFEKSLELLCHGRGLRKGTHKWYEHWQDTKQPAASQLSSTDYGANLKQALNTACIFKVHDDCRQDALTIQFVRILYDSFSLEHSMPLYLYPYRVVPNRTGKNQSMGGIIQVIPDVRSRDDIGKSGAKTLLQHFRSMYGPQDSAAFKRAQRAFACSQAAYAVVCYLLQIKDRHNGNLVVDKDGHVIHIDFGFLLGISPGKNLGFETAAFKFSTEMFELLGGSTNAEPYIYFLDMTVKAFLISRELKLSLLSVITSFSDSGLPCFTHKPDNIEKLLDRFMPDLSDSDAAVEMKKLVNDACRKWTTVMYDGIQKLQNNIYSDAWM